MPNFEPFWDIEEPLPPKRKVTQLLSHNDILYALCDDGTFWREYRDLKLGNQTAWYEVPNVPQN